MFDYTVLEDRDLKALISAVNGKIKEGWIPLGGVAMKPEVNSSYDITYTTAGTYAQAMYRQSPTASTGPGQPPVRA